MIGHMLIAPDGASAVAAARKIGASLTAAQVEQFAARVLAGNGALRIMTTVDGVAEIAVYGVLTETPDYILELFGGGNTSYSDIRTALRLAAADPAVREVVLSIASPGGYVVGLFETLAELAAFEKPLRARASMALSAAYGIASQCDAIEAVTSASYFGSVGVAVALFVDPDVIDITNSASPDKRPDPTTPEGKATVQKELDAIFQEFGGAIARGRGATLERVTGEFGRGRTLLTAEAKAAGMIDSLASARAKVPAKGSGASTETLAELLATRLPEETAEAHVRRCVALLERVNLSAATAQPARPRETLEQALGRIAQEGPPAFAGGVPEGIEALARALDTPAAASDGPVTEADLAAAIEAVAKEQRPADPSRESLAAAVGRMSSLDWEGA